MRPPSCRDPACSVVHPTYASLIFKQPTSLPGGKKGRVGPVHPSQAPKNRHPAGHIADTGGESTISYPARTWLPPGLGQGHNRGRKHRSHEYYHHLNYLLVSITLGSTASSREPAAASDNLTLPPGLKPPGFAEPYGGRSSQRGQKCDQHVNVSHFVWSGCPECLHPSRCNRKANMT